MGCTTSPAPNLNLNPNLNSNWAITVVNNKISGPMARLFNKVYALLRTLEQILLVNGKDWEEVRKLLNLNSPTNGRDSAKLKCKFQQMYRVVIPTGNPRYPHEIRMMKRIREHIRDKMEIDDSEGGILFQDPSF